MNFDTVLKRAQELVIDYVPSIVAALLIFIIGLFVIGHGIKLFNKFLEKTKMDSTLRPFIVSFTSASLKILLILVVLTQLGAQLSSFVAIIGASSLAIGLAFQGVLSNFAGGVLLLSLRPFKVGDYINAAGFEGIVEAIHIFNTVIVTPDNKVITVPNGNLSNASVTNFTAKASRRVDLTFTVSYEQNIDHIKAILTNLCDQHEFVHKDPAPFIKVLKHGDHAIHFVVRIWTNTINYWDVYFDLLEQVKKKFDEEKVSIPYQQMDIHMISGSKPE